MTRHRIALSLVVLAIATLVSPAAAQECGIRRLGGPNRFVDTVDSEAELQSVFKDKWSEIKSLLSQAWPGDPDDLAAAIARGDATEASFPPGTRFEWMIRREQGKPSLLRGECWGGSSPFPGYAFSVESRGRRFNFAVPKACGNLSLLSSEALSSETQTAPTTRTQPPPPAPAPPPRPAQPPAPPPPPRQAPPPAPVPPAAELEEPEEEVQPVADDTAHWNFELFAGYFFPEELDEDLTYGLRFGRRYAGSWGWQIGASWFDVADSQGFSGADVDADVIHVDLAIAYYPMEDSGFHLFFGPGFASGNVDVPGTREEISDDVFSAHAGLGYEIDVARNFYVKPDARIRWYELEGFGEDGGRDNQITYEAAIAIGWRFGR